jgi:hypothetical protein
MDGPVHVSMNDYLVHRVRDIPRVALAGLRFRRRWTRIDGALGLWFAALDGGRRQISVSVWRRPEDLHAFVRSQPHLKVMRDFRDAGDLINSRWSTERLDRSAIWQQAEERLMGRVPGVRHH